MGKINLGRVILGGIVAGIVMDLLDYLVDGVWLAPQWTGGMQRLGHTAAFSIHQIVLFDLIGIACGVATVWLYAAIRPRFGAGIKTAVWAGLAVWFVGTLLPNAAMMYVTGLFGKHLTLYTTLGGVVEIVVGAIAGAALYKEAD
jgi:hypothetical protein